MEGARGPIRCARRSRPALSCALIVLLSLASLACATSGPWQTRAKRWGVRGLGAVLALGLHEVCHVALGAALGADINAGWRGAGLHLQFSNLSTAEDRSVAMIGNACTGLAAEIIVDTRLHKRSQLAWGAAAFHAMNAVGYSFADTGDASYWSDEGGSKATWAALNATHGSRIAGQLAWEAGIGNYVIRWWRQPARKANDTRVPRYLDNVDTGPDDPSDAAQSGGGTGESGGETGEPSPEEFIRSIGRIDLAAFTPEARSEDAPAAAVLPFRRQASITEERAPQRVSQRFSIRPIRSLELEGDPGLRRPYARN